MFGNRRFNAPVSSSATRSTNWKNLVSPNKILIVDDDEDFVSALRLRLEAHGYQVVSAHDVVGAITTVESEHPDLIILDVGLPVGNGILLLRRLRATQHTRHLPILILTAQPPAFLKEEALREGATGFLQKPADSKELLSMIRQALDRDADSAPTDVARS
jgi:DNA-binding response OmpR family regulator